MSSTSTQTPPSDFTQQRPWQSEYVHFKRYAAYTFLFAAPVLIALPPRKLDLHTAALTAAFAVSANHIVYERSGGRGITDHLATFAARARPGVFRDLPTERAEEVQRQLRETRMRERANRSAREEQKKEQEQEQERNGGGSGLSGVAKEIWMGGEKGDWRERRAQEEKKALEEGKGYADLIVEHVKDAWGVDKTGPEKKESQADNEREKK